MGLNLIARNIIKKIEQYSTLVMFEHTIFSLSFGLVSMLLASQGHIEPRIIVLILIVLLSARTGANAINRAIDAEIDAKNPRTQSRQLPSKILKKKEVIIFSIACFLVMIAATFMINTLSVLLLPIAIFMMLTYSYTKRFTWACHLYLGITCAIAPMGAWIAVTGSFHIVPLFLSAANALWVAGFDIIYGSQDFHFDTENNIHSMPQRFGVKKALYISAFFHFCTVICLFIVGHLSQNLGLIYYIGVSLIAVLLVYEHKIISPTNLKHAKIAAYGVNQLISIIFMAFAIANIFLQ